MNKAIPINLEGALKMRGALESMKQKYPSLYWVPNVAQERALEAFRMPPYPFVMLCTLANGTGKTCALVQDVAGTCQGSKYVNPDWNKLQYYDECKGLRERGKLRLRLVCDAQDMEMDGSVYTEIKEWIPTATFHDKAGSGYYKRICIPVPELPGISNNIQVRTFNQDKVAHSGTNMNRIWVNEPMPRELWGETVGRSRSKADAPQCHILVYATVLDLAGYLFEMLDDETFADQIVHVKGSTWENCIGSEVPPEIGQELGLARDNMGNFITRGVLTRKSIENMIATWRRTSPQEVEARVFGRPMHLGGPVWASFNEKYHVINDYKVPQNYPVVQIVDPHPKKPDFSAWFVTTPFEQLIAIAEWPEDRYDIIKDRQGMTIEKTCECWRMLEAELGIAGNVVARYGDPNMLESPDPVTGRRLKDLYAAHGFSFITRVNDDIDHGHRLVESFLWYDTKLVDKFGSDPSLRPRLMFVRACSNLIRGMGSYSWKQRDPEKSMSDQVDKRFKEAADVVRYRVETFRSFAESTRRSSSESTKNTSDASRVKAARQGKQSRPNTPQWRRR